MEDRPNVELRRDRDGLPVVVLNFPYDPHVVAAVRRIPGRRFDWDTREWWAPLDDWAGVHVLEVLDKFPELTTSTEAGLWLKGIERRWVGKVTADRHEGKGWFVIETRAGTVPEALEEGSVWVDGKHFCPMTPAAAEALDEQRGARLDSPAQRCLARLLRGETDIPPASLTAKHSVDGEFLKLDVLWDPQAGVAFDKLPGAGDRSRTMAVDPWVIDALDPFIEAYGVEVTDAGEWTLDLLRAEHEEAMEAIESSRATAGEPIPEVVDKLGGTLDPFQWAGVRYLLDHRRAFLADEQGLGKTVQALATLEADDAWPAVVVCPASLKLNWQREAKKWLPHRSVAVIEGRGPAQETGDLTILNYEVVAAHRDALARQKPQALVIDESHYVKNPSAKRTHAVRRLAEAVPRTGLRLALSGTPVLNHADELIAQLRILGRLEDFGSGARFKRQFQGELSEERLHWHLRRVCFVRRLKSEVLPQLPAKRQVVVPMRLDNEAEYRRAEEDVVAWLQEQPLDLRELNAKIARVVRAERLAQLGVLKRLAAKGKLDGALAWIHDFLASGEPLVVFAHHVEVQEAVMERFPDAAHLLGKDSTQAREAAVRAFQEPGGPQLIVCATRVAAQGITLTRASNVAFLELEWTPAMHDQAEDRCHRIGQTDSVTAWYLLAANTIDETMAELLQRKRGVVAAVTDGVARSDESMVDGVVRALRDGEAWRRLRPVA